ncbi:MAG: hypothetical protein ACNA7W_09715 [Pseudomonadales bacterium]
MQPAAANGANCVVEQSKEAYYLALRQTQGTIRTEARGVWYDLR